MPLGFCWLTKGVSEVLDISGSSLVKGLGPGWTAWWTPANSAARGPGSVSLAAAAKEPFDGAQENEALAHDVLMLPAPVEAAGKSSTLLVVHHSPTASMRSLVEALLA